MADKARKAYRDAQALPLLNTPIVVEDKPEPLSDGRSRVVEDQTEEVPAKPKARKPRAKPVEEVIEEPVEEVPEDDEE